MIARASNHFEVAVEYYENSIQLKRQLKYLDGLSRSYFSLALIYQETENWENALTHFHNALKYTTHGSSDKFIVQDWYKGSAYHVEQFKTADNRLLLDNRVENLVQAMAAFAPPAAGQSTLPQNYHDALAPVIAANWQ